ncbi:hypothetical protein D3C84_487810 [compost metagenome]
MTHLAAQAAHDGGHDVYLGADVVVEAAELLLHAGADQQQRHVEAEQVHFGQLLVAAETMVAHHHEQGVLEVGLLARLLEELAQGPVGVAHGGQVLVMGAMAGDLVHR